MGAAAGAILLGAKSGWYAVPVASLRPWHAELMLLGWFGNLTLGVAYWILPKHATGLPRGATGPVLAAYLLLNAGVMTAALGSVGPGRAMELLAVFAFAAHAGPRIKGFGAGRVAAGAS